MKKKSFLVTLAFMAMVSNVCFAGFSLNADDVDFDMKNNLGVAKGNVVLIYDGGKATGNYAQFNNKTHTGYLEGNVVADKDGYHITADKVVMHDENHTSASGNAVLVKDGKKVKAPLIDYYKDKQYLHAGNGRAILTDVDGSTVEADEINYDHVKGIANANGKVRIRSDVRKLVAQGDKAVYNLKKGNNGTNYIELIGNARATQDGNTVSGNRLKLSGAKLAQAEGRVIIDFTPKDAAPKNAEVTAEKGQVKSGRVRA